MDRALALTQRPSALLLTRQNVPFQNARRAQIDAITRGAYVLAEAKAASRR
jgi:transketolase